MFDHCLYFNTTALARVVEREWARAFKPLGVTPPQGFLLRLVLARPGLSQYEIADALKQSGAERSSAGDLRVPVAIVSRFTAKGDVRAAAALYQLSYVREGHLLGGSSIRLRGLALVRRVTAEGAQAAVDKAFKP